jgi:antitoxin PrlF
MIKSKLTAKAQTTIPRAVREALHLKAGDEVVYVIQDEGVVLRKASSSATEDPFRTFNEWDSRADRDAYADL